MAAVTNYQKTICFVAGKSGGHIIPCLTIKEQEHADKPVLFFSTNRALDKQLLNQKVTWHVPLPFDASTARSIRALSALLLSTIYACWWLIKKKPYKIISTGGLIALPVCIAGFLLRIPIELFELNATPGKAISFLAPFASHIWVCFDQAQSYFPHRNCSLRSYPLNKKTTITPQEARRHLLLNPDKKTILIVGGSQGSTFINRLITEWIGNYAPNHDNLQIIHQGGLHDITDIKQTYATHQIPALVFAFSDRLPIMYTAADVVICRAGAGTLFEVMAYQKPCITIPLATKETEHQVDNAQAIKKMYSKIIVLDQKMCTGEQLAQALHFFMVRTASE